MSESGLLLVPQPLQRRTVFFGSRRRRVLFPYSLFAVHYYKQGDTYVMSRLQVAFSQKPLTGKKDSEKLYGLPLSNTSAGHEICLYSGASGKSLKELAQAAIKLYWSTSFVQVHDGYGHWLREYRGTGLAKKWKDDPDCIMSAELKEPPYIVNVGKLKSSIRGKVTVMSKITDKVKINLPKPRKK